MTKLLVFESERVKDTKESIEVLEDVLQMSKEGEVRAVAIAYIKADGTCGMTWSSCQSSHMLGAIELMKYEFMQSEEDGV